MNINDIWNGFLAIYNQVTPALLITIAAALAIILSCPGLPIRNYIASRFSTLSKSQGLEDFGHTVEQLRIGVLIPIIAVVLLLAYLVILGDLVSWVARFIPRPLQTSYTSIDILAEQRRPDDLAIIAASLLQSTGTEDVTNPNPKYSDTYRFPHFYEIIRYYERQRQRLQNKFPERYRAASSELSSGESLYGGFLLLTGFFIFQLIMRKIRPNWLWFSRTTFIRTFLVLLVLLTITARYRLQWEWATEHRLSSELSITADILREENKLPEPDALQSIKEYVEVERSSFVHHRLWLARYYDRISMGLWSTSHRQLG